MRRYYISFDFESRGGITPRHGFSQLAASLIDSETKEEIDSFSEYVSKEGFEEDPECMNGFWAKHPEMLKKMDDGQTQSTLSPYDVVDHFVLWCQGWREKLREKPGFLTDNAAYDAGILRTFSRNQDILKMFGSYEEIFDVSNFYVGLAGRCLDVYNESSIQIALERINQKRKERGEELWTKFPEAPVKHDHDAVNDARVIGWRFCTVMHELNR